MFLETPARIEPCFLEAYPSELADVIAELVAAASKLDARLHPASAASLAELVRLMNCYYSNLIEGHNTRPRDIERALADDFDRDGERRDLQIEARAHIRVQREVDALCLANQYGEPATMERIRWLHREFYATSRMLTIRHHDGDYAMVPGELRAEARNDVMVGRHQPPSSARVPEFMAYFQQRYRFEPLRTSARIVAMAAAHQGCAAAARATATWRATARRCRSRHGALRAHGSRHARGPRRGWAPDVGYTEGTREAPLFGGERGCAVPAAVRRADLNPSAKPRAPKEQPALATGPTAQAGSLRAGQRR